jgi:FtsZ-binding cell division protein ZapB
VSEEVDALRAARDELGEQLAVLQQEHIAISTLAEETQRARGLAESQLRESKDENETLRGRIGELTESTERANEKIAALRNALSAYERAHTASQDAIAGLQTEVEALREQNRTLLEERRASGTYLEHLSQALTAVTLLLERRPARGSYDSIESVASGALAALELALDDLRIARVQTGPHPTADDDDAPSHTPVPISMPEASEELSAAPDTVSDDPDADDPDADDADADDAESTAEIAASEPMFNLDDAEFLELESDLVDLEDL